MKQNLKIFLALFLLIMGTTGVWADNLRFSASPKGTAHSVTWDKVEGALGYRLTITYDDGTGVAAEDTKVVELGPEETSYVNNDLFFMKDGTSIEIKTESGYTGFSWITFATRRVYYYIEKGVYFKTNLRYASDYIPANDKWSNDGKPDETYKEGYTFKGWSTTPNGTPITLPYELTQPRTDLYGVWEKNAAPAPSAKVCDVTTNYAGWVSYTNIGYDGEMYDVKLVPSSADTKYKRPAVQAYKANYFTGHSSVMMESVTNIPYGEGVFIHGTPETTYDIVQVKKNSPNFETNLIVGVTDLDGTETSAGDEVVYNDDSDEYGVWLNADGYDYVLLTDEDNARSGLYMVDDDLFIPAEHAYLHVFDEDQQFDYIGDLMAKELTFVFDDDATATGISTANVADKTESDVYYNLAGQKVASNYKGVVINGNGKKIINNK